MQIRALQAPRETRRLRSPPPKSRVPTCADYEPGRGALGLLGMLGMWPPRAGFEATYRTRTRGS
eukprot:11555249-Alexandrium_andersonii.AAC.1